MGLTLREGDREYFYAALDEHFPGLKQRYIRKYGNAYELQSPNGKELMALFNETCRKNQILCIPDQCFSYISEFPDKYEQMSFFR